MTKVSKLSVVAGRLRIEVQGYKGADLAVALCFLALVLMAILVFITKVDWPKVKFLY